MPPKLFDTHTHFNFNAFKDDCREVIERTLKEQVWFVNVGAEAKTSRRAVDIAEKYPEGVFAAVGLHPIHTYDDKFEETVKGEKVEFVTKAEAFDKDFYAGLVNSSKKVVAIGETGLDYFHIKKFTEDVQKQLRKKQQEIFEQQVNFATEVKKPIIIHCRHLEDFDAYKDILNILKNNKNKLSNRPGIAHFFAADKKIATELLNLGFKFGFNGVITFTSDYDETVKYIPLEKIVLETDSPWLAPVPHRGKRNESLYVEYVAKKISALKGLKYADVASSTTVNAQKLFGLI